MTFIVLVLRFKICYRRHHQHHHHRRRRRRHHNTVCLQIKLTSCAARWPPQYAPAPADRRPTCLQI